jgi:hypothetical protein
VQPFAYGLAPDAAAAAAHALRGAEFIAGGTDMLQLLQEGLRRPEEIADVDGLPMAGITEEMILGAMPHPQYGRARYGAVRSHYSLLPTTILGTPVPDDVMAVHYDVILPTGALQLPDDFDPTEADDDLIDRIRSALNAPMAELLRLFEPRVRR